MAKKICKHCGLQYSEKVCPRCGCSNVAVTTTLTVHFTKGTIVVVYLNGVQKRKTTGSTKILLKIKEPSNVNIKLYFNAYDYKNGIVMGGCSGTIYPGHKYGAGLKSGWFAGTDIELCCVG